MNEDELVEYLNSIGYKEVFCENMSMKEKIYLFKNADSIIGPIGGGMCNLLFARPTTEVISLMSPTFMEVNERFLFTMNNCNPNNLDISDFYENRKLKTGMRVKINNNKIGEIEEYVGNSQYKVSLRKIGTTGCESTNEAETEIFIENELEKIGLIEGLN